MKKFKVRTLIRREDEVEAESAEQVANRIRAEVPEVILLGVIPADQEWPDRQAVAEEPFKRPPRNTPPSGSPGTPTPCKAPEFVEARAA